MQRVKKGGRCILGHFTDKRYTVRHSVALVSADGTARQRRVRLCEWFYRYVPMGISISKMAAGLCANANVRLPVWGRAMNLMHWTLFFVCLFLI